MDVSDGKTEQLVWPTTRLALARPPGIGRDLILVQGIEPNMRWRGFTAELVTAFTELGVEIVILLGALLADSPHTRPVPVSAAASDTALARPQLHLEPVDYKGPTGIVGVLQQACSAAGLSAVSSVGCRAALRGSAAEPEGDAGAAAQRRGHPRHLPAASRPACRGPCLGARR